jgi:hypothetical protein
MGQKEEEATCRKMKIRTITDPRELLQAQIDDVHVGNLAMREKIKNYRAILKAGGQAEEELRAELVELKATEEAISET